MPTLKYFPSQGGPREYSVHKAVTTIGRSLDNDFSLQLPEVAEHHAQILFDGRDFSLEEVDRHAEILINGKKKRRGAPRATAIASRSARRARVQHVRRADQRVEPSGDGSDGRTIGSASAASSQGLRKLHGFSEKLMHNGSIDELLETMLDDVIELTDADKGFILLDRARRRQRERRARRSRVRALAQRAAKRASPTRVAASPTASSGR